jgi:predicted SAM-dependent methyltransferase
MDKITMIETINYKDKEYPMFQTMGNASQFAIPFAKHVCLGEGYDIGCMKKEWSFPGSIPIDLNFGDGYHATNLPKKGVDYIFSSHCLEHIDGWVDVMDYWYSTLKEGGTLFLYLPDYSQEYWRPWNNKKHRNIFIPEFIRDYMIDRGYKKVFVSGVDLNDAFMVMGEK